MYDSCEQIAYCMVVMTTRVFDGSAEGET